MKNLRSIPLGFRPESVVQMRVDLSRTVHRGPAAGRFFDDLLRRARELPGAQSASLSSISLLSGAMQSVVVQIPGYAAANGLRQTTYFSRVSAGFLGTMGIPLLAGRDFGAGDGEGSVIVNEQLAREYFAGDALGKTFAYGGGRQVRVVGICGTAKFRGLREDPRAVMYLAVTPAAGADSLFVQVRTSERAKVAMEGLLAALRQQDARVPAESVGTMEQQIDQALARERLLAFLSGLLAGIALLLAAIGLYGVLSYSVARRRREIGIRMAVGSDRRGIVSLFLRESGRTALAGLAVGAPLAWWCGELASSLLYGVEALDAGTAIGATGMLAVVAIAAAAGPAWRAARMHPMAALRHE